MWNFENIPNSSSGTRASMGLVFSRRGPFYFTHTNIYKLHNVQGLERKLEALTDWFYIPCCILEVVQLMHEKL